MVSKKKLPVGVDIFDKLIRQDFYYVDKTRFIAELLRNWGEVNLFTRQRRFGKFLNKSMLKVSHKESWLVISNAESGEGYSDILLEVPGSRTGVVTGLKYAQDGHLDAACAAALRQIKEKNYEAKLKNDGMETIVKYGIACYKKRCRVAID